jgi:hypothetical protein
MRRFALLGLTLLLPACSGFSTFFYDTHWFGDPNKPLGDSENMRRVRGQEVAVPPLLPEPGNVWPGPIPAQPTLEQLMREEKEELQRTPAPLAPGQPAPPPGPRSPRRGSSTPPGPIEPGLPPLPNPPPVPAPKLPSSAAPHAHTYVTPTGPMTGTPGPGGYETLTTPSGESGGLAVPNGNGTTTIILPDGRVLTVPSPK